MMSRNVRGVHVAVPLLQAGGLQGARLLRRRRHRHGAVLGPARDRRRREDRLPAGARLGLADDLDVGLPARPPARQAAAVHRRLALRAPRRSSGAWRSRRRRPSELDERDRGAASSGSRGCRSTSSDDEAARQPGAVRAGPARDAGDRHRVRRRSPATPRRATRSRARPRREGFRDGGARARRAVRRLRPSTFKGCDGHSPPPASGCSPRRRS